MSRKRTRRMKPVRLIASGFGVATLLILAFSVTAQAHLASNSDEKSGSTMSTIPSTFTGSFKQFAGDTLHWTQMEYKYDSDEKDPANGKVVTADIWLQIDAQGIPSLYHARTFLPDGTMHQDVVTTPVSSVVILGKDYAPLLQSPSNPHWCILTPPSPSNMASLLPPQSESSNLAVQGFQQTDKPTGRALPETPALSGVSPYRTITPSNTVTHWRAITKDGEDTSSTEYDLSADNRVLVRDAQITNVHGAILQQNWNSFGVVNVYMASTVPPSVFRDPNIKTGGC